MSPQARLSAYKEHIQEIMNSGSSVGYTIEPEFPVETAWEVFIGLYSLDYTER